MADLLPAAGPHLGCVASFDRTRGLGRVEESDGTGYLFHATAIADGSRDIEVDAAVTFTVTPGHRGEFEARSLTPIAPA
jgi:cold shock CspA family protein